MPEQLLDFTGKVVLITGARSGIGQATAVAFAKQGARVVIAGRSNADKTMEMIKAVKGEAIFVRTDVSRSAEVQALIEATLKKFDRIDVAFNNSGLLPVSATVADMPEDEFDKIISVDLKGVFLCMKYEIQQMLKQGGGAIVNCSSVAGLIADPNMCAYVAAKHGVAGLTKAAGIEYATQNIRVNAICPGLTDTEMTSGWLSDPKMRDIVKSFNAMGRAASSEEIAGLVLFLASPLASFMTGGVYAIDAGQTAH